MRNREPYPCTGVFARALGRRRKDMLIAETRRAEPAERGGRGARVPEANSHSPPSMELQEGASDARHAQSGPLSPEVLTIVATGMPDVYVAVDDRGRELGARVSVPTLALSVELRDAFALTPPGEAVLWTCYRNPGGLLVPVAGGRA
jgi:hypothetical protein